MERIWRLSMGLALVSAVGCGMGTGGASSSGGTSTGPLCPDDPGERAVLEECGIWVSASMGNDASAGSQSAPVATLQRAIELAASGPGKVYACGETWTDALELPGNVSLHGGFDCANGWAYAGKDRRALIAPAVAKVAVMVVDGGMSSPPFVTDVEIRSPDAKAPGESSIGLFVRDDVPLTMLRSNVLAGNGADGLDGTPGDAADKAAEPGAPGNEGGNACAAPLSKGGASPVNACSSGASIGGAGGDSSAIMAMDGIAGEPVAGAQSGTAGTGEQTSPVCTQGKAGADGNGGASGEGGRGHGRLTPDGYVGASGKEGAAGTAGQGGGGGGATFGKVAVCGAAAAGGAAGGSGGSGGCGGKGGKGGQAGGASIALATRASTITLSDVSLTSGAGGKGGDGGAPQQGGTGGMPGQGGAGAGAGSIKPGCAGGSGGAGGKGGWGGGGAGGVSFPLLKLKHHYVIAPDIVSYFHGKGGEGGIGEAWENVDGRGDRGAAGDYDSVDP